MDKMLKTTAAVTTSSIAVLMLTGCSERGSSASAGKSASPSASRSVTAPPAPVPGEGDLTLELPSDRSVIVPEMRGGGSSDAPAFTPVSDVYTIYFVCSGGGKVSIKAIPGGKKNTARCDGTQTYGIIIHEGGSQRVKIRAQGKAEWRLAILDGTPPWAEIG
ncbi:hypothetical protein ACFOWE_00150 [Planomonospora corallina]|uniref:Lipoprotein n=1 Tax=Planomonospora corallina TaxID=1806052 RepID=A0ABV8HXM6_9ACTN